MAFHDLHGKTSGAVAGAVDITSRAFEAMLAMLLPNGPAWPREDATLRKLVAANAVEFSRLARRGVQLDRELNPATTFETVADWEASYGLPDCAQPVTLEARRVAIAAKLLAQTGHDQSPDFWQELLKALGYLLHYVVKGQAGMTCIDDCMDVLFDDSWVFVWQLAVNPGLDAALLACVVEHNALVATDPIIHYLWTPVAVPEPIDFAAIACTNKGYTAAAGGVRVLFAGPDIDNTLGWYVAASQPENIHGICAVNNVLIAVGVAGSNTLRSLDGGATWTSSPIASGELWGVSRGPAADNVAVAVGEDGQMWRTTNAGLAWTSLLPVTAALLFAVTRCIGAMIAVGSNGVIIRGTNNGLTWAVIPAGVSGTLYGVSAWLMTVIAVGASGRIWRSSDAGATWSPCVSPTGSNLYAVTSSPTGRWTACGASGTIVQSLDDGKTWVLQVSPVTETLRGATAHIPTGRAILVGAATSIIVE